MTSGQKEAPGVSGATSALVLGGGGVTGIAWELGMLAGLRDAGIDVTDAELIVGTSAGANVGAMVASGTDLDTLFARQLAPVDLSHERAADLSASAMGEAGRIFAKSPRLATISSRELRQR